MFFPEAPHTTAYLLARIDPSTMRVIEYKVLSEPRPSAIGLQDTIYVEVYRCTGANYAEALRNIWTYLDGQPSDAPYGYIRRWMDARRLRPERKF